jgi:hypothetical protein
MTAIKMTAIKMTAIKMTARRIGLLSEGSPRAPARPTASPQ